MNTDTKNTNGEYKTMRAKISKKDGSGVVSIGDATFTGSREDIKVGGLILVINGDKDYANTYRNGEVYKVTNAGNCNGDGTIEINKKWNDGGEDGDGDVMLFKEEYTGLIPANFEAILFKATVVTGESNADTEEMTTMAKEAAAAKVDAKATSDNIMKDMNDVLMDVMKSIPESSKEVEEEDEEEKFMAWYVDQIDQMEEEEKEEYDDDDYDDSEDCINCDNYDECYGDEENYEEVKEEDLFNTQESILRKAENTLEMYSQPFEFGGERAKFEYMEAGDAVTIALIKRVSDSMVLGIGYSQCSLDDEYHETIGRVIASFRAAGEEVPTVLINFTEFPTE